MGRKVGMIHWHLPSYLSKHRGKGGGSHGGGGGWLLSACRYPRTASFAAGRCGGEGKKQGEMERAATMDDINRFLCENFSSLYDGSVEDEDSGELVGGECSTSSGALPADGDDDGGRRRICRGGACEIVLASSQRFFGSSIDEEKGATTGTTTTTTSRPSADDYASSSTSTPSMVMTAASSSPSSCSPDCHGDAESSAGGGIPDDGVAVVTFSKDPQDDFLRSMEEMLAAHLAASRLQQHTQVPALVDWDFMQELLLCYLHLNDASVHGHILQAFADLVAELRTRKDVILSVEPGKGYGDTDPTSEDVDGSSDDVGGPVLHRAMFSHSR